MQRFKNILLLAPDGEPLEPALARAASLARRNGARLTVAGLIEALPRDMQMLVPALGPGNLLDLAVEEKREELERLVAAAAGGCETRVRVLVGKAFLEAVREVLRESHDLVMMPAEEQGLLGEVLAGSTSMHLLRKCPCPVWIVRSEQHAHYARVLAAVDPLSSDDAHLSLDVKILGLASSLARHEGAELHVLHAWRPVTERVLALGSRLTAEETGSIASRAAEEHARGFENLLGLFQLEDLPVRTHLLRGDPAELIVATVASQRIDIVVMGTVCRAGVAGLLIGNTAEKVLRRVDCSALTVKPDGFVTPIRLE